MKKHQHGTLTMRRHGACTTNPCDQCRDVGNCYARRNTKLRRQGRVALVDAEPARLHVKQLLADGMTAHQIEQASGVHRTAVRVLIGDFPNRKQSVRIRPTTAAALLRVQLNLGVPVGNATVLAVGTRRRIQALQASGYTARYIASRIGSSYGNALQVARKERVLASTARAVIALYDELRDTPGPSSRARRTALTKGYLAPIWWDDDDMDDLRVEPGGLRTYSDDGGLIDDVSAQRAARTKNLLAHGMTRAEIAAHLGISTAYVRRDLAGRTARLSGKGMKTHTVDEIKVDRVLGGGHEQLNPAERDEVIRRLHAQGLSDREVGERIDKSVDAVLKLRHRNNIGRNTK